MCGQSLSRKQIVLQRGHGLKNTMKDGIAAARATRSPEAPGCCTRTTPEILPVGKTFMVDSCEHVD